jgi:hypothetical protein
VDHARAEHLHDLDEEHAVEGACVLGRQGDVDQAWCGQTGLTFDELHDQNAFEEVERLGNQDARRAQSTNGVDLGGPPCSLHLVAAIPGALFHRSLASGVANLSPLGVVGAMLEAPLLGVLVDLGHADLAPRLDEVDSRFFPAHERPDDAVDNADIDQRFKPRWDLHEGRAPLWCLSQV